MPFMEAAFSMNKKALCFAFAGICRPFSRPASRLALLNSSPMITLNLKSGVIFYAGWANALAASRKGCYRHRTGLIARLTRIGIKRGMGQLIGHRIMHGHEDLPNRHRPGHKRARLHLAATRRNLHPRIGVDSRARGI